MKKIHWLPTAITVATLLFGAVLLVYGLLSGDNHLIDVGAGILTVNGASFHWLHVALAKGTAIDSYIQKFRGILSVLPLPANEKSLINTVLDDIDAAEQALAKAQPAPVAAVPATAKTAALLLAIGLGLGLLHSPVAFAQDETAPLTPANAKWTPTWSFGLTIAGLEYRPRVKEPLAVAAGAGVQAALTFPVFQLELAGETWDMLAAQGALFGSLVSPSSGPSFGALSAAIGLSTLSGMLSVMEGHDVVDSRGGLGTWFTMASYSVNFDFGPPPAPLSGATLADGTPVRRRARTVYLHLHD